MSENWTSPDFEHSKVASPICLKFRSPNFCPRLERFIDKQNKFTFHIKRSSLAQKRGCMMQFEFGFQTRPPVFKHPDFGHPLYSICQLLDLLKTLNINLTANYGQKLKKLAFVSMFSSCRARRTICSGLVLSLSEKTRTRDDGFIYTNQRSIQY